MRVRDIFSLSGMKYSHIKAGVEGLDRVINTVTVLEVTDVEGQNWLIEGQLYITSLYSVMNNIEKQLEIIQVLINSKSAGIIICHIEMWLKKIDPRIIDICNKYDFPLIVAESNTSYIEIMNPIILKLMADDSEDYVDTTQMQNKMIELVVNRKDVSLIYRTMSEYYKNKIWFLDIDNRLIYPKEDNEFHNFWSSLKALNNEERRKSPDYNIVEFSDKSYILKQVFSEGNYFGIIVAEIDKSRTNYFSNLLDIFSMIFALITTKSSRVAELERRKKEEFLSDLITWNFRSNEVALRMGKQINWDITKVNKVIVINMNIYQEKSGEYLREVEKYIETVQYSKIKNIIRRENKDNLIGVRSDLIIILLSRENYERKGRIQDICNLVLENWDIDLAGNISIGVSESLVNYVDIPKGYNQAIEAMRFSREYFGNNNFFEHINMGAYSIIKNIKEDRQLMDSLVGLYQKLIEYDQNNHTELYKTLKELILNDMDFNKTSEIMFLHKNTILYRKNKIQEILGYEPWKMPYLLNAILLFSINNYT